MTVARRRIVALPRPRAQRARIAKLLHEVDVLLAEYRGIEDALRKRDYASVTSLARRSVTHSQKANTLSRQLGAPACAGGA
jgi:hypothetical protein